MGPIQAGGNQDICQESIVQVVGEAPSDYCLDGSGWSLLHVRTSIRAGCIAYISLSEHITNLRPPNFLGRGP